MGKVRKEIIYWSQLLLLPIYGLSCLVPRNKKLWVLGSSFGMRFADNPKYFYLYLSQAKSDRITAVWISKNKEIVRFLKENGYRCHYLYSWQGIMCCVRAGVYLFDNYSKDICYTLSGGAIKINLWHGIPLKKIQKDNLFDYYRNPRNTLERIYSIPRRISDEKPSHYVLTTSTFLKPFFSSAFQTKRILVEGYPRNDFLISDKIENLMTSREKSVYEILSEKRKDFKIVSYMPTFRKSEQKFFEVINIERLSEFMKREKIFLCVKLHPKSRLQDSFQALNSENILVVDPSVDPYAILKLTDILITDYSSICYDFMLTGRQILFFPYDYKEYIEESRELYFDYSEFTPGHKVFNQSALEQALFRQNEITDNDNTIQSKVFDHLDDCSCERLYDALRRIIL